MKSGKILGFFQQKACLPKPAHAWSNYRQEPAIAYVSAADITDVQAAAASTLFVGSVMLAIGVARGTLELLLWGCRVARPETNRQPGPEPSGPTRIP